MAKIIGLFLIALSLGFSNLAEAKKSKSEKKGKEKVEYTSSSHEHQQEIGAFAGITMASGSSNFTLGGDYEYRLQNILDGKMGILGFAEMIFASSSITVFGAGVTYHVIDRARLVLGIGSESGDGHSDTITRVGGSYEFDVKGYTVSPTIYIDSAKSSSATVLGATVTFPL